MASMRVHELAKEFNMSSKDMLDKLHEMKIPAKSHASMLAEAYVEKVRKNLAPEIKERAGELPAEEAKQLAEERAEAKRQKAEQERARREAVEQERAAREAERARRAEEGGHAPKPAQDKAPKKVSNSPFESLQHQIESEKERVAREAAERKARARAAAMAKEVAKKQAVEEALRNRNSKGGSKASAPAAPKRQAPVLGARKSSFDSLLSQIESEKQRIEKQKAEQPARGNNGNGNRQQRGAGRKHGKKGMHIEQHVPELEQQNPTEDRYAQMAVKAEELQRDKVLAEARAAVAAASSHEGEGRRKKRKQKREAEARERLEMEAIERGLDPSLVLDDSVVEIPQGSTVAKFAELLGVQPNDVIKRLFMLGQVLTLTQSMSDELVELIADDMGRKVRVVSPEEEFAVVYHDSEEDLKPRPPVVTVMGHVDHGKTSLLDAIRHTGVAEGEAGGITQHIGASVVRIADHQITFIDTPGHEAFTAMRARGAQVTDVIVLVVAADDGVMPQTVEAINHAQAAHVPIVVAVNKIDKPGANPDKVRGQLTEYGLVPEEYGGNTMFVDISAKQGTNVDKLLEAVLLTADAELDLRANPDMDARGATVEARLDKGRGAVATVLVQSGTLHIGDAIVAGTSYGRVRAMLDENGNHMQEAGPSTPVQVLGLTSVPTAGDLFLVASDDRTARQIAEKRQATERAAQLAKRRKVVSLESLKEQFAKSEVDMLNIVIKGDSSGSVEALEDSLMKIEVSDEVGIQVIHRGVGAITQNDVNLATVDKAVIIGFNVRPNRQVADLAEREGVEIKYYSIIYKAIEDIEASLKGMLKPEYEEVVTSHSEIREIFRSSKFGNIAGVMVQDGEVKRGTKCRILRNGIATVNDLEISSLRRFKDDVNSVKEGYEAGINLGTFNDIEIGDIIETFEMQEIERK